MSTRPSDRFGSPSSSNPAPIPSAGDEEPSDSTMTSPCLPTRSLSETSDELPTDLFTLAPLPDHIVIGPHDDEAAVIQAALDLYEAHFDRWFGDHCNDYWDRHTRPLPDEQTSQPLVPTFRKQTVPVGAKRFLLLPDGRRVLRIDNTRVLTMCGLRELLTLTPETMKTLKRKGSAPCPRCYGRHLTIRPVTPVSTPTLPLTYQCPKCHSDAEASMMRDHHDLVCILCGYRLLNPTAPTGPQSTHPLTKEEIAQNETALQALPITDIEEEPDTLTAELRDIDALFEQDNPDPTEQTSPLTFATEPDAGLSLGEIPPIDEWAPTTEAEAQEIADRIHQPIHHLFRSLKSPLRREIIGRAILELDDPTTRMLRWAAVGRLLNDESVLGYTPAQTMTKAQADEAADWYGTLDTQTLSELAGDPLAFHPWVAQPQEDYYEPANKLLDPIVAKVIPALRRFRVKEVGIRKLAKDFCLPEEALRKILTHTPPPQALNMEELARYLPKAIKRFYNKEAGIRLLARDHQLTEAEVRQILINAQPAALTQ